MPNKPSQTRKTSRKLEVYSVKEKEDAPKSHQKVSKKLAGFIHTLICVFFPPSYLLPRTECFSFALLKLKAVMWLRDTVGERDLIVTRV